MPGQAITLILHKTLNADYQGNLEITHQPYRD